MKSHRKPSNRSQYRTPTPFASDHDYVSDREMSPQLDAWPKFKLNPREFNPVKQEPSADKNSSSEDEEVEIVGMSKVNKQIRQTGHASKEVPPAAHASKKNTSHQCIVYTSNDATKTSNTIRASDAQLDPSPNIIDVAHTKKYRPKPIPVFKKNKQKDDVPDHQDVSDSEPSRAEDEEESTERTPKSSRTFVPDDDATPTAHSRNSGSPDVDIDVTPKADRTRKYDRDNNDHPVTAPNARQTRASNGISKKRVLHDAAILSSDDDLPSHITPKKIKVNNAKASQPSKDDNPRTEAFADGVKSDDDDISHSRSNIEPINLGITKRVDFKQIANSGFRLSSSKGKKRAAADENEPSSYIANPMASIANETEEDVFASDLATATRNSLLETSDSLARSKAGQSSGTSSAATEDPMDAKLHPDEIAAIDAAMRKTRDEARRAAKTAELSKPAEEAIKSTKHQPQGPSDDAIKSASDNNAKADPVNAPRRTFGNMVKTPGKTPMINSGAVLLDDTMKFRVAALPNRCDVTRSHLQDSLLADDYAQLPKLRLGALRPWNAVPGSGSTMISVWFSGWAVQCPNLDFDTACAIIRMDRYKNFINPSRASPIDVNILYTSNDSKRSILQCNFKTAVCLSPILTRDSYILEPTTVGLRNKYISGHFHHQEWERLEGFACMVFDKKVMTAQIRDGALSFTTMGNIRGDRELSSPNRPPRNPSILSAASSRGHSLKHKIAKPDASVRSVLDVTDDIPVYDARGVTFNFTTDLEDMDERLPRWLDEVPSHSFAVVGYTMGHYEKENRANLTTNVLFVILLATECSEE